MSAILMFQQEVMDSHKTVSTNHNIFEEKGESKRIRTEVPPLTNLNAFRWAKRAHSPRTADDDELMLNVLRCQLTY